MLSDEISEYLANVFSTPGHKYTTKQRPHAAKFIQINDYQRIDAKESGHLKLDGEQKV